MGSTNRLKFEKKSAGGCLRPHEASLSEFLDFEVLGKTLLVVSSKFVFLTNPLRK